ncbi:MAG TPA: ABC transporter ATP-binding protein [Dehalococcoidia bacterium]|nr:ABC transporter ATP-binding protein [Dehalococcoidia bacterium]
MIDLELKNICKSFGSLTVLADLSLNVYKGELCCLLGPSGCGKTTLLKIINGLLEPDSGAVLLAEKDITALPCQRRDLGMVFQNYALFPHMSVFDNVAYGLRRRRWSKDQIRSKVDGALALVRLPGYEKRRIHELSGGQQQRVALARALVIEPQALLLDEPLSNLDAKLRADMRDEIRRIQSQLGITTVYVTHDQEEAMSIADRIVVMNDGNIEQIGTPEDIYDNPATKFVATFVGSINFIPGEVTDGELRLLGCTYRIPAGSDLTPGKVLCAIRPERIRLNAGDNTVIRGKVKESEYLGSIVRYLVVVNDGDTSRELTVQVPVSQKPIGVGENVGLEIGYDDIHFFPGEP